LGIFLKFSYVIDNQLVMMVVFRGIYGIFAIFGVI